MFLKREGLHQHQDPLWIYDAGSGTILDANPAALAFLDLTRRELLKQSHPAISAAVWEFSDGQLRSKSASPQTGKAERVPVSELDLLIDGGQYRLVIASSTACEAARRRLRPSGHDTELQMSGAPPFPAGSGRAPTQDEGHSATADIYAKIGGYERQLEETEAYLENTRSLLEVASWRYHYNTGRIDWSQNTASVLRLDGDVLPRNLADYMNLIHPEDRTTVERVFRDFRNSETSQLSFVYRLNNTGQASVHVRGKGTLVETPDGMTLTGIVQNVTDETEARSEMELLRQCIARVNDIIIVTEAEPLDGPGGPRIVFANEAFERLTGYRVIEALGATPRMLQGPETDIAELRRIRDALADARPVRGELLNYTRDAAPYWVELEIVPVSDGAGRTTHFIAIERDITERRQVEERLRASERMEALGKLTGGIAHDFNNFLTVLLGNSETLASELPEGRLQDIASLSVEASLNAADLVRSLLAFARRQRLEPVTIDVNERISEFSKILRRTLPETIAVMLSPDPDIWPIRVDPGQLESCLLNLCVNSRDAMPGGGDLLISTENTSIGPGQGHGGAAPPGDYVVISVRDTGSGMSETAVRHAFEPFFTTKATGAGSGLGLSSVHGFVTQSGGYVSIQSTPGMGTCVRLEFPRSAPSRAVSVQAAVNSTVPLPAIKVLLVEDNMLVREHAARLVRQFGMDVVPASTGAEAMDQLRSHPDIHLVFTDIVLPGGMDGFQIGEAACKLNPDLKVIYTTGFSETTHASGGAQDPSIALIRKPYTRSQLYEKFAEILLDRDV